MSYKSMFAPVSSRPKTQDGWTPKLTSLFQALQINTSISTWLLIGASLQAFLVLLFSTGRYVMLIGIVLLSLKIGRNVLQAKGVLQNPFLEGVIPHRVTALVPDEDTGAISEAGTKPVTIFLLGAKSNHPYGLFAPQFVKVNEWLNKMTAEFNMGKIEGFMGQTTFSRQDAKGAPEVVLISYWQSVEHLWQFAHTGTHRETWNWWEKTIKENDCVGINHEVYQADPKNWENIYANFQPTMMGATTFLRKGDKLQSGSVPDQWISPLIDASRGKLAKSSARMGRPISKYDATRPGKDVYATESDS